MSPVGRLWAGRSLCDAGAWVSEDGAGAYTATITYYESAQVVDQDLWNELVEAGPKTVVFHMTTNDEGLVTAIVDADWKDLAGSGASSDGSSSGGASNGGTSSGEAAADSAASTSNHAFWGIWVYAKHDWDAATAKVAEVREAGYFSIVMETTDWENLNDEHWYVVSAGIHYNSEEEANEALPGVRSAGFPDAYVKWTGAYIG